MMSENGFAYFIQEPRIAEELLVPHLVEQEQAYEIVKTIFLPKIDYENFITDMLADRWFLDENAHLCCSSPTIRCLLVKHRGQSDGILVVPNGADVGMAAYRAGAESVIGFKSAL